MSTRRAIRFELVLTLVLGAAALTAGGALAQDEPEVVDPIAAARADRARVAADPRLPADWIDGSDPEEAKLQVHWFDENTVILRQSKRVDYEAPFMYLLFGNSRALLLDTGSRGEFGLREKVDELLAAREKKLNRALHLVVSHTHGHGDHVVHDADFEERENTTLVKSHHEAIMPFYGIKKWPTDIGAIDLGGRVLDVVPTPGHHAAHLCFYDRNSNVMISGDTFYPGFIFIFRPEHWDEFKLSARRLLEFSEERRVALFLGCHIEMTSTPGVPYPYTTVEQPDETYLQLSLSDLREVVERVEAATEPGQIVMDRVIIEPAYLTWAKLREEREKKKKEDEAKGEGGEQKKDGDGA